MRQLMGFTLLCCLSLVSWAQLHVLYDAGHTQPAASYTDSIKLTTPMELSQELVSKKHFIQAHPIHVDQLLYPRYSAFHQCTVITHRLTAAHFSLTPLFLISTDAMSLQWVKQNAQKLKSVHAFGMITNVDNAAQTAAIEHATGLTLMPVSLAGLSEVIGTRCYPFLIDQGWVVQ